MIRNHNVNKNTAGRYLLGLYKQKRNIMQYCYYTFKNKLGVYQLYKNIDWTRVNRLIFICYGNICRSPYAEYKARQLNLTAISAGVSANDGSDANEFAIKYSSPRNVDMSLHKSRSLEVINYSDNDLVLAMEPWQIDIIRNDQSIMNSGCQISLLGLWCDKQQPIIQDPYGKAEDFFQRTFDYIDDALASIVKNISNARVITRNLSQN